MVAADIPPLPDAAPPTRRGRRSTEEVVERLLDAATHEFEEKGFGGATTAAIARRAGVAEALLFKHFGSKTQLFQDAIFGPLSRQFDAFMQDHPPELQTADTKRALTVEYIGQLQDFVGRHARALMSLMVAQSYKTDGIDGIAGVQGLRDFFDKASSTALKNIDGEPAVHPALLARISFVSILSCLLFQDWLFEPGLAGVEDIRMAISAFVMEGLTVNTAKS